MSTSKSEAKTPIVRYLMSIHYGICAGPVDSLNYIKIGEKKAWSASPGSGDGGGEELTGPGSVTINRQGLFGGDKKEGGVKGTMTWLPGRSNQVMPSTLAMKLGLTSDDCPAYRGIASIWFHRGKKGFLWGTNNPYIKSVWANVTRRPRGLNQDYAMIEDDANPAYIIYECLTNKDWGMGVSPSAIDEERFQSAGETLFFEDFGISLMWSQQSSIEDFLRIVINHIEGVLFVNPSTGKLTLDLIRGGYSIEDLPVISPSNANITDFQQKHWNETINEIVVSWTNPKSEKVETVSVQDAANIAIQGAIVSDSKNYEGVRRRRLAMRLARRDLKAVSSPFIVCTAIVNRTLSTKLTPGSLVILNWPEHGIQQMVMRVGPTDYGRTTDSTIKLNLTEDVFGSEYDEYEEPPETEWVDESEEPAPLAWSLMSSAPYYLAKRSASTSLEQIEVDGDGGIPMILGAQTGTDTAEFLVSHQTLNSAGDPVVVDGPTLSTVSRSLLSSAIPFAVTTTVTVSEPSMGADIVSGSFAVLGTTESDMEICVVTAFDEDTLSLTLRRGCLDTIPKAWDAGTPIWFVAEGDAVLKNEVFPSGAPIGYTLRSVTSLGTQEFDSGVEVLHTISDRALMPLRPANVMVNGVSNGVVDAIAAPDIDITWSNRNRMLEDSVVLDWSEASVAPEDGQTTRIDVMTIDGTILVSHTGLTGTSYSFAKTDFASNSIGLVRIMSERDGLNSLQAMQFEVQVDEVGYGEAYGVDYGGTL